MRSSFGRPRPPRAPRRRLGRDQRLSASPPTTLDGGDIAFHAVPETIARTTLGDSSPESGSTSSRRFAPATSSAGTTSRATSTRSAGSSRSRRRARGCASSSRLPPDVLRYCVEKGSVTVDGVSLTVAELADDAFAVALVPHTLAATTLSDAPAGTGRQSRGRRPREVRRAADRTQLRATIRA